MDAYRFGTNGGQVVLLRWEVHRGGAASSLRADAYHSNAKLICSMTYPCTSATVGGGNVVNLTLTNSGTFTVLVHSSAYILTGSYAVSIQTVTGGGCNSQSLSCGQSVSASTSFQSQMDAYGFGTGGGTVIFS